MTPILKTYLEVRWRHDNHSKYQKYFTEWLENLTPNQIKYLNRDMMRTLN